MTNKKRWDAILLRIPEDQPYTVVEVGVWGGELSEKLLEARPKLFLYQVDRWCPYTEEEKALEGNTRMSVTTQARFDMKKKQNAERMERFGDRVETIDLDSIKAAENFPLESVDMVFIDALHSYEGCKADIMSWLPIVKDGGWIGGHDYPSRPGVKKAVDEMFGELLVSAECDRTWFASIA